MNSSIVPVKPPLRPNWAISRNRSYGLGSLGANYTSLAQSPSEIHPPTRLYQWKEYISL